MTAEEVRRQVVGLLTPCSVPGRFGHDLSSLIDEVNRTTQAPHAQVTDVIVGLVDGGVVVLQESRSGFVYARLTHAEQQTLF